MFRWFRSYLLLLFGAIFVVLAGCNTNPSPPVISPTFTITGIAKSIPIPTPTAINPPQPVTIPPLLGFQMMDVQSGWGWGEGRVLRTSDGGLTWTDVTPKILPSGGGSIPQVAAGDARQAWVVASDPIDFNRGKFFRTQDGGQSWQTGDVPFGEGMLQRLNDRVGFFMAGRGVAAGSMAVDLYQTLDGGATWVQITHIDPLAPEKSSLPFGGLKSGIGFRDELHGWVVGSIPMEGAIYFYATADGGKTWRPQPLDLPEGLKNSQVMLSAPRFFGEKNALLPALFYSASRSSVSVLYSSQDGGVNWSAGQPFVSSGRVFMLNSSTIFSWDGITLVVSQDGGKTWNSFQTDIDLSHTLMGFQFVDAQTGWALSNDGKTIQLYRTLDGGKTWK